MTCLPSNPSSDGRAARTSEGISSRSSPNVTAAAPFVRVKVALHHVHRRRTDESGDEQVRGMVIEVLRNVDLLQDPLADHGDPVAHRHRLDLVVRDVQRRDLELVLDAGDLRPHLDAELRVEVRQRLVHQERLRLADDRPPHGHALPLATRQRLGLALEELVQTEDVRGLADAPIDLGLRQLAQLQTERHVVVDRHVRVQRVVLEHHRDVPLLGRNAVHDLLADPDRPARDRLQTGDHAQRGRLPAAGRADQDDELAVGHVQGEVGHCRRPVSVHLGDVIHRDLGQGAPLRRSDDVPIQHQDRRPVEPAASGRQAVGRTWRTSRSSRRGTRTPSSASRRPRTSR